MTAARVLCWRHGRTGYNHTGTWQGQLDIPLDEVGRGQAVVAARAILDGGQVEGRLTVVSSDLSRARDTAGALADLAGVTVRTDARLREIDAGNWQGLTRAEIATAGLGEELAAWRRGEDIQVGGGERRSEAAARCAAAVAEYAAATTGTLVVVGHGGVLRGTVLTLLGLPPDRWTLVGVLGNAHWAVLGPGPGRIPGEAGPEVPGAPGAEVPGAPGAGVGAPAWTLLAYNLSATPSPNRFGAAPPARGKLTGPRH